MMKLPVRVATLAIGLALVVVLLGGWTRLNDAGLGCPDWPGCYGTWVLPDDHTELAAAHPDALIDLRKGWIEMIHRYAAGTLGLLVLWLAVLGYRYRERAEYPSALSGGLLVLVVAQAIFGMWTVTLQLLPAVVTLHLLGGLSTLALLVVLRQRLLRAEKEPALTRSHPWVRVMFLALFIQLALGGWTSTNYAGWACSDWFYCHQDNHPGYDFSTGLNPFMAVGPNYEGGLLHADARAAIQVTHRAGALLLIVVSLLGTRALWRRPELRRGLAAYWSLLLVQVLLGVANIIWMLPLGLAVAHHAGAVAVMLALLHLNGRVRKPAGEINHGYAIAH